VLLAGELAAFVDAAPQSTVLVLDLRSIPEVTLARIMTSRLVPGMHLLLRSEGGGDYIELLADAILGAGAQTLREQQIMWKERLRERIADEGANDVAGRLKELGVEHAGYSNVRYWASAGSLRTSSRDDFVGLMTFLGLAGQAPELWLSMEKLDAGHRRAGKLIRQRLLSVIGRTDLTARAGDARIDFELPANEGGRLSAYRIEDLAPEAETRWVSAARLGRPVQLEEELWPE
jgi:hypothetical protein